jgi:hypothetical protein
MSEPEDALHQSRPPSLWRYWLKRLGWTVLILLVTLVCTLAFRHHQSSKRLQEALAELDRTEPGWRLQDIEAARERVPEEENSAPVVLDAVSRLPGSWPALDFSARYSDLPPQERLSDEDYRLFGQELNGLGPALQVARSLADMPHGRHRITYERFVLDTRLNDQQKTRRVVSLLFYDALRQAQRKDPRAALRSCRAALNAARSLGDEPFAISQLIRVACVLQACQGIERTLAQGEPAPEDLASLQPLLREEDAFADQLVVARGERASVQETFAAIESGQAPLGHLEGLPAGGGDHPLGWLLRARFVEAHPAMLDLMTRWVAIAQLPVTEQINAEKELDKEVRERRASEPLAVLLLPALQKLADASRRKHAYLRCTDVALACERYRREHREWPASLDSLCPHFLPRVPLDPFDGKPLRYKRVSDGVLIYSVGNDGIDNGGSLDRKNPTRAGADMGLQLWNVTQRRQPPAPRPNPEPELIPGIPPRGGP